MITTGKGKLARGFAATVLGTLIFAGAAFAQSEAVGGGYAAVLEGGGSPATKKLRQNLGGALRQAAARAKAKRATASSAATQTARQRNAAPKPAITTRPATPATNFRAVAGTSTFKTLAEQVTADQKERELLVLIFESTKTAFEEEVANKGRPNNLAAAFTFFIGTTSMVYHDDPEPSEKALDALWDAMDETLGDMPELAQMSDRDKQETYDTLIALSGVVLVGHLTAKQTKDAATLRSYQQISGIFIEKILQTSPDSIRFSRDGLDLGS
ncbi:hypothetical protein BH24ACI3_BH24ACI3_02610 [soil metagenome]